MNNEIPPAVMVVLRRLWESRERLHIDVLPKDAWTTVAVIQYATRNPQLSATQREAAVSVGRALQRSLERLAPAAADLLEDGWNPDKDVPRENRV